MDHHGCKGDLIEVMVQDLTQRAAIVGPSCLLTINGINSLIPEVREPTEKPDPAWQRLREARIHRYDRTYADQWEEETEKCHRIWSQPIGQAVVGQEFPEGIVDIDFERRQSTCLISEALDILKLLLREIAVASIRRLLSRCIRHFCAN